MDWDSDRRPRENDSNFKQGLKRDRPGGGGRKGGGGFDGRRLGPRDQGRGPRGAPPGRMDPPQPQAIPAVPPVDRTKVPCSVPSASICTPF